MFDNLWSSGLILWLATAIVVAGGIGFLPRARLRLSLILIWSLVPVYICLAGWLYSLLRSPAAWLAALGFYAAFVLVTLPLWAVPSVLSFTLVRRIRELGPRPELGPPPS